MLPRIATRLSQWIQHLPEALRPSTPGFGEVLEARLRAGDSLKSALEHALPRLGALGVRDGLAAEDGPVALVCVDLLRSLADQLHAASLHFGQVQEPWAQWTSARMSDFATALEDDVVHSHLVNAVLAEAAVTSELIPIEVHRINRRGLETRVVQVLLQMRSTFFTRADLVQTASTLGRAVPSPGRLADA